MSAEMILAAAIVTLVIAAVLATLARYFRLWASGREQCEQFENAFLSRDAAAVRNILDASPHFADDPVALFSAIVDKHDEILAVLLDRGADVHRRLEWGGTALHIAARLGTVESVQALLAHGAAIDEDCRGTPLYWAADQGRPDVVELLLRRGANPRLVAVEKVGKSAFKPKFTGPEGFEAIRQRLAEAQRRQADQSATED